MIFFNSKKERSYDNLDEKDIKSQCGLFRYNNVLDDLKMGDAKMLNR